MTLSPHRLTVRFVDRVTGQATKPYTFDGALTRIAVPADVAANGEWDVEILSYTTMGDEPCIDVR